jgi:hypothetical protein
MSEISIDVPEGGQRVVSESMQGVADAGEQESGPTGSDEGRAVLWMVVDQQRARTSTRVLGRTDEVVAEVSTELALNPDELPGEAARMKRR